MRRSFFALLGRNGPQLHKSYAERIEVPKPEVRDNDVLVEVHAASVNRLDTMLKNGEFKLLLPQKIPLILGNDLREIGSLIDSGIIRPVVDRAFPFESTKEALAYVEKGRAKGKVVVKVR